MVVAWWGPVLLLAVALGMLAWSWRTWPDVLIDFGLERYVPWRLAEGAVLYRDVAHYNGPLSQYFNALCFALFGASIQTLAFCNLAILAGLVALLHVMLRRVSRPWVATVACLVFLLLFAFAQYVAIGNYNYVCPYAHEVTHGLVLSLLALALAWPSGRYRLARTLGSGLALGLVFLTKAEMFLPGALATGVALALGLWWERVGRREKVVRLACFLVALLVPPAIAFLALASAMPVQQALRGTLGSWVVAVRPELTGLKFFRQGMGTDRPLESLRAMLLMTGLVGMILGPAALLGLGLRRPGRYRTGLALLVFVAVAGLLWGGWAEIPWSDIARPLPLGVLAAGIASGWNFWTHRHEEEAPQKLIPRLSLLVFALVLLSKMLLNARIFHYGFVLAMPASLLLVVAAFDWVPAFLERRGGSGGVFRAAAAALLVMTGVAYLDRQAQWMVAKQEYVGAESDGFWADGRGAFANAMVAEIARRSSPDTTLAVLPEGSMLNCLSGLRNPTPYCHLTPIQVILFGEERICAAYRAQPPDLIVWVHRDSTEFGFPFFGRDFARQLGDWIRANYRERFRVGLPDQPFGMALLERNDREEKAASPVSDGTEAREGPSF